MDKRVKRTRERLRKALLELILEMPYDEITVRHILLRADTSRSAFYAHFRDKDDLLMAGLPEDILSYGLDKGEGILPDVTGLFAHVLAGKQWLEAMSGNAGMILTSQMARQRMAENWLAHIVEGEWETTLPPEAVAHYLTGALMALLQWWIGDGMGIDPAGMNQHFHDLVGKGLGLDRF